MHPFHLPFIVLPMADKIIKDKILAVGSGKGGVGKTTTSVNLALYYSKKELNVLLVDADPLSDITTLLDISEPESILKMTEKNFENLELKKQVISVFANLDLLIPLGKQSPEISGNLLTKLTDPDESFHEVYDLIILDLPAGLMIEEGCEFIKSASRVLVITNDEPTSHVSAGAFIKTIEESAPGSIYRIWHNKYAGIMRDGFDPQDLPGNYNRNVPEEEQMDFSSLDIKDRAYIPEDPALDLLKSSLDLNLNIKRQMLERVEMIYRERIGQVLNISGISSRMAAIMESYIAGLERIFDVETSLAELGNILESLLSGDIFSSGRSENIVLDGKELFTNDEKKEFRKILNLLKDDNLSSSLRKLRNVLSEILEEEENSQRLFFHESDPGKLKNLDRELSTFLSILSEKSTRSGRNIRNLGGLLLFDFSLFKLFKSATIRELITGFIPWRETEKGQKIRDKYNQIKWLVETDGEYRNRFLSMVKTLYPVLLTQIEGVASALELKNLLFRNRNSLNGEVYLRLLTTFLHDILNSGLGVIMGFRYRPASRAFQKGARQLLAELQRGSKNE